MVLIIKLKNSDECFVLKMSEKGYYTNGSDENRLYEIIENMPFDKLVNRKEIYRKIIDKLYIQGRWRGDKYTAEDVSNTLHDKITECFSRLKISKYFIELDNNILRK